MRAFVDVSDISISATRTVTQTSAAMLGDVLDNEQGVEGFFDYFDEWEDDCDADNFEYHIEVSGVVPMDRYKHLQERIHRLEENIEKMKKEAEKVDLKGEEE